MDDFKISGVNGTRILPIKDLIYVCSLMFLLFKNADAYTVAADLADISIFVNCDLIIEI